MNYLSVDSLTKSVADKVLFKDLTFGIAKGQKVGLVAKNGAGKSSLLKCITGKDAADSGVVSFRNGIKVGYLDQAPLFEDHLSVGEAVFVSDNPESTAVKEYENALQNPEDEKLLQKALVKMDELNAWDYEARVTQILSKLHITDLDQKVGTLSGGQQKRIALAQLFLDDPEFLILDEPTNHLDLDIIEWLEEFLSKEHKTILMVTHDRYFLELVCNEIIELDEGELYSYEGNYSKYLQLKEERDQQIATEVSKARNLFKKELEWVRRQPKARGTKAKYRVDAFHDLKKKAKGKGPEKSLDLEVSSSRLGKKILEIDGLSKKWGDYSVVDDFSYIFKKNEKIGIVGKNGVGKTTFLNLVTGREEADAGNIEHGQTLNVGYYTQKGIELEDEKKVIEVVRDIADYIPLADGTQVSASQMLERFLFTPEMQWNYVHKLSGGERKRLYLLTVLMDNPNFLILDEPTNDLDLVTLNVLEEYLNEFQGCAIVVSHDRYFMDKIVDQLFVFEGHANIRSFNGTYTEYQAFKKDQDQINKQLQKEEKAKPKVQEPIKPDSAPKAKLSYKEKVEFEQLDGEIAQLQNEKERLEQEIGQNTNPDELQTLSEEYEKVKNQIDEKELRWLELSELA